MRISPLYTVTMPILAAVMLGAVPALAGEYSKAVEANLGTYQCGPERLIIDATWDPGCKLCYTKGDWRLRPDVAQVSDRVYDGIHYWLEKRVRATPYDGKEWTFVFGLPVLGSGQDVAFARNPASRFVLYVFADTTESFVASSPHRNGHWQCFKQ
jgi:hypothetical protein